jgi:hypothetical protein
LIKFLLISIFLLNSVVCIQAESENKILLVDYLKSKFLGRTISLSYSNNLRKMSLKVKNVIEDQENKMFKLELSDKSNAIVHFQTARNLRKKEQSKSNKYNMMQINSLKSQELINFAIQDTMGESSNSRSGSSSLKNLEENMDLYFSKNSFTTTKEIIYTDLKSQKIKEDFFVITTEGLFLNDGKKITIIIKAEE